MTDLELLAEYYRSRSESAFTQLVRRHVDWVYSTALRRVHDRHLAEDVTQGVFLILARDGRRTRAPLSAWLYTVIRYLSANALRQQARRRAHEQKAAAAVMAEQMTSSSDPGFSDLSPHLEEIVGRLRRKDRQVILLRFYEHKEFAQIAGDLGISEEAARKRVTRAVEKLRDAFARRKLIVQVAALAAMLSEHATQRADASLAASSAQAALTGNAPASVAASVTQSAMYRNVAMMSFGARFAFLAMLVIVTICGVLIVAQLRAGSSPAVQGAQAGAGRMRIGFLISQYTATGPCWTGNRRQFGYLRAREGLGVFQDPQVEPYAIIETDTNRTGMISPLLRQFQPDHILDGSDAKALGKLDAMVSYFQWNVRPEVLKAMDQAVHGGVGLYFQATAGCYYPGYTKEVQDLQCIRHAHRFYVYLRNPQVHLLARHPILMGLENLPADKTFEMVSLSGSIGEIQGTPLMSSEEENMLGHPIEDAIETGTWDPPATQPETTTYYPLYVGQLGKGRVVACQWEDAGKEFTELTQKRFPIHCLQWLSGRDLR